MNSGAERLFLGTTLGGAGVAEMMVAVTGSSYHPLEEPPPTPEVVPSSPLSSPLASPQFILPADEESRSTCPLLYTPSPPQEFNHPLALAASPERRPSPCSMDTETSILPGGPPSDDNQDFSAEISDARVTADRDRSSSSSSCSAMPDSTGASAQLLKTHHYMTLSTDPARQENGGINGTLGGFTLTKTADYSFMAWNWPKIRKICFWSVMSISVAFICIIIGYISTLPTRCDPPRAWFQGSLIYEIFPGSFQDSDANGIGDLKGIVNRIDYLERIGAKAVKLDYIFPAEHYPEHYDQVENLTGIDPVLGTFSDFKLLVDSLHERNISLILDLPLYRFMDELKLHDHGRHSHHVIVNNHILASPNGSSSLGSLGSRGFVTDLLKFWLELGVDGFYLRGLQNFVNDDHFGPQVVEWRKELDHYSKDGEKIMICAYDVVSALDDITQKDNRTKLNMLLKSMDLVEVRIEPFSKTASGLKTDIKAILGGPVLSRPGYPWIYWTLGGTDSSRLSTQSPMSNLTMAAILAGMMLPGSSGVFYGDERGLADLQDPEGEREDLGHAHHLVPMHWSEKGKGGFTAPGVLPWIPLSPASLSSQSAQVLAAMSSIKDSSPAIYMNGVWRDGEIQSNTNLWTVETQLLGIERRFPRRHTYLFICNLGPDTITTDLSSLYYGGYVVLDQYGTQNEYITFHSLSMTPGQYFLVRLDK